MNSVSNDLYDFFVVVLVPVDLDFCYVFLVHNLLPFRYYLLIYKAPVA